MTTKEQERKALAQIKKIVEGLGEDSYIGTAFEGCFEIAEQNIEFDWGCSMQQRWQLAEKDANDWKNAYEAAGISKNKLIAENAEMTEKNAELCGRIDDLRTNYFAARDERNHLREQVADLEAKLATKDAEILQLKAKLYDLICK